jgi:cob(I)alamin adenosyltransferase
MRLDKIYTRGGDDGRTSLGDGQRLPKYSLRVAAYGTLDEANSGIGVALLYVIDKDIAETLRLVQNDLFDVGADLCRPEQADARKTPLRVSAGQVARLEQRIDRFNGDLAPLTSFVLPGGSPASAFLHQARTIVRRAERDIAELASTETINPEALKYVNRLSDLLFVLGRHENGVGANDVLWAPGLNH